MPGFEPGSTDRESDMMDRTTPHERQLRESPSLFQNVVFYHRIPNYTFTFTYAPFGPINMPKPRHRAMIGRRKRYTAIRYRKRPEPYQVVPLSSLKMTGNKTERYNHSAIVSHSGDMGRSHSWSPITRSQNLVEISPKSWAGLHKRMMSSRAERVEVS